MYVLGIMIMDNLEFHLALYGVKFSCDDWEQIVIRYYALREPCHIKLLREFYQTFVSSSVLLKPQLHIREFFLRFKFGKQLRLCYRTDTCDLPECP